MNKFCFPKCIKVAQTKSNSCCVLNELKVLLFGQQSWTFGWNCDQEHMCMNADSAFTQSGWCLWMVTVCEARYSPLTNIWYHQTLEWSRNIRFHSQFMIFTNFPPVSFLQSLFLCCGVFPTPRVILFSLHLNKLWWAPWNKGAMLHNGVFPSGSATIWAELLTESDAETSMFSAFTHSVPDQGPESTP